MSTPVTQLCNLLVDDIFGEYAAQLFQTLSIHGRLSLPSLGQHSGLLPRQVRHGLSILVQQNLAVWAYDQNDNPFYEAHHQNAYNLIRQGKLARVVGERFGQVGQSVVTVLLLGGHARVADVVEALVADKQTQDRRSSKQTNGDHVTAGQNGVGKNEPDAEEYISEVQLTILALIDQGFLAVADDSHFRPMADVQAQARQQTLIAKGDKVKKAEEPKFENDIRKRLLNWKYNQDARQEILSKTGRVEVAVEKRRRLANEEIADLDGSSKRQRVENGPNGAPRYRVNGASNPRLSLLDDYVVKINYEKLAVVARNEQLVLFAKDRIGEATSLVYEELLSRLTVKQLYCQGLTDPYLHATLKEHDDFTLLDDRPIVLTRDVVSSVDLDDYGSGIGAASKDKVRKQRTNGTKQEIEYDGDDGRKPNGTANGALINGHGDADADDDDEPQSPTSKRKKRKAAATKRDIDGADNDNEDAPVLEVGESSHYIIRSHLLLLKEDNIRFADVHRPTHVSPEGWSVDFSAAVRELRIHLVLDIIRARFGEPALRLVNILREKGKFEQKHLQGLSLMNQKQMLALLSGMQTAGYIDLQEVPRDSTRAPIKTIYLWFFEIERCARRILEDTYKAMARTLQRIGVEKERHENVIRKSERTDVAENEDEMLTEREKRELKEWRDSDAKLMAQLTRLDDVVFCLRDF